MFDLKAAGFADPVLVSTTDGVGTKLRIAIETGMHDSVGIDLVAMCVNDLVVQGAEPLFFLDYFATASWTSSRRARWSRASPRAAGRPAAPWLAARPPRCPACMRPGDYDLAGFAVGAAERGRLLPQGVGAGDAILGLASSGVHSNGYSLVRRIVAGTGLAWTDPAPFAPSGKTLGQALMRRPASMCGRCCALHRAGLLKAAAHITGGGLPGNLPRVLPDGYGGRLAGRRGRCPPVFGWLARTGGVASEEMLRVFNCGIGMALVVSDADAATRSCRPRARRSAGSAR